MEGIFEYLGEPKGFAWLPESAGSSTLTLFWLPSWSSLLPDASFGILNAYTASPCLGCYVHVISVNKYIKQFK